MFAKVPETPGVVLKVAQQIPSDDDRQDQWHHCGVMVKPGWDFNGSTFSPPQTPRPPVEEKAVLKSAAHRALLQSDVTLLRCIETNTTVTPELISYRALLRQIVNNPDNFDDLPEKPAYPTGT